MKKNLLFLIVAAALMLVACARLSSSEDTWLCTDQGWVRHGNPSAPMPTTECGVRGNSAVEPKPEAAPETRTRTEEISDANIRVTAPVPNETVGSPFEIRGEARVFESQFNWKLKGDDGAVLSEGNATAMASDMGQFGPFVISVKYGYPSGGAGTLEVFDYSAKDGSVTDLVSIPLQLQPSSELETVKLFFMNNKLDTKITCEKVFPVERTIKKSYDTVEAALQLLLMGPLEDERGNQYTTQLNDGVHLNKLTIVDGVAKADFDKKLEEGVGGSCRVGLIRKQIEETLKQFPEVKEVVISIEDRTEDILQP